MKRTFSLLLLLAGLTSSYGQYNYFPYYTSDSTVSIKLADSCSKRVGGAFVVPQGVNAKYKKDFLIQKEGQADYTKSLIKHTNLRDSILYPFLVSVYNKIAEANPSLKNYSLVISDWPMMNACYIGGRVIVFYAPLLSRMKNESQVAAILCHELAHGELDHVQKGIKKRLDEFYDKDFQEELRKTLKEEFNLSSKINLLALKYAFTSSYHHRSLEKEADSLGYVFLSKTNYDTHEALSALAELKVIDKPAFDPAINYSEFFKCSTSTFDFSSIKPYQRTTLFNVAAQKDTLADSLRTHPDCDKRIGYIKELMKTIPPHHGSGIDTSRFSKVKWAAAVEMIMGFHSYEYYDLSLFNALLYLKQYPDNDFLKAMVILNWYGLYNAMKNHELADYVSNYSDENPAELNNLIHLINSLRLPEMAEFGNCFSSKNKVNETEYSIAADYCTSIINDDKKSSAFQEQYKSTYKNGRFISLLDLNQKPVDPKNKKKKN